MNLAEAANEEEDLPEVKYDEYDYEEEDVDVLVVPGESLKMQKMLATPRVIIDWRLHSIFGTRAFSGGKVCNVILDGSSSEDIISEKAIEKLKSSTDKHPTYYKVHPSLQH